MSEKNQTTKLNKKEIIKGLVISLVVFIVIISVGYGIGSKESAIWPAAVVTDYAIAGLWLVALFGGFSMSSSASRKVGRSILEKNNNKLGAYSDKERKQAKTPWEIERDNKKKSKQGVYTVAIVATIILLISIPFII